MIACRANGFTVGAILPNRFMSRVVFQARVALIVSLLALTSALATAQDFSTGGGGAAAGAAVGSESGDGVFDRGRFRYSVTVREGFDDNVFTQRVNKKSSFYTNFAAGIAYDFGSPRLRLTANLGGGVTYYYTRPGDKIDYTGVLSLTGSYLVTPRFSLNFSTRTGYFSQPDLFIAGTSARRDGDYFYTNSAISATYAWTERFSTTTGYNFTAYYYPEQSLNDSQGRISQTLSQSFNFLLWPTTTLVAEYRINPVTYYSADQNNLGNYALLGFDHVFNPRSTWTLRAGAEQRFLNNATDGRSDYIGPFVSSSFNYQFGPASDVTFLARYGTEGSGINGVTIRETFRLGLTLQHAFTARISGNLGFAYLHNRYDQPDVIPDFDENIFEVSAGVRYQINRLWSVNAGYNFTGVLSGEQVREYNRNIAFIGTTLDF